jgi:hypothetical protein
MRSSSGVSVSVLGIVVGFVLTWHPMDFQSLQSQPLCRQRITTILEMHNSMQFCNI